MRCFRSTATRCGARICEFMRSSRAKAFLMRRTTARDAVGFISLRPETTAISMLEKMWKGRDSGRGLKQRGKPASDSPSVGFGGERFYGPLGRGERFQQVAFF